MKEIRVFQIIKGLLYMLTRRVERLEKRLDELEEKERATSNKEFNEDKRYYNDELSELDKLI